MSIFDFDLYNTEVEDILPYINEGVFPKRINAFYNDGTTHYLPLLWHSENSAEILNCEYENPFILQRADPYIFKGPDGYYYFTASYPAFGSAENGYDRIILRRSKTVKGLAAAEEKTVWTAHKSGVMSRHIWAPEIHFIKDKWYIFFAAGEKENIWNIRPFVLMCEGSDPYVDSWAECGIMKASSGDKMSFRNFSLDMTYFEHKGNHYLIWAQIEGDSSLFMATINPDEPWQLTSKPILLTKPEYSWEKVNHRVNEGASVLRIKDKIFVFFSASGTGAEYCMGALYADIDADLMKTESWIKTDHSLLETKDLEGEVGPGHNSFVTDENGNLLLVYHSRPASHLNEKCSTYCSESLFDPCRHTRIKYVFISADGIPKINMKKDEIIAVKNRIIKL